MPDNGCRSLMAARRMAGKTAGMTVNDRATVVALRGSPRSRSGPMRRASRCQAPRCPMHLWSLDAHHSGQTDRQAVPSAAPEGRKRHMRQWGRQQCRPHFRLALRVKQIAGSRAKPPFAFPLDTTNHIGYTARASPTGTSDGCGAISCAVHPAGPARFPAEASAHTDARRAGDLRPGNSGYAPLADG